MVYYNEFDPKAAAWLRVLMEEGHIPPGDVDERSIEDVAPSELVGYTQCHFFAGIGGWALALRLAGIPDDFPVWTGSCPCQPFSQAGKRKGVADERHLWPAFHWHIHHARPEWVFGEQVSGSDGIAWLGSVFDDLEASGYVPQALDIPACSVGAPHRRNRIYWAGALGGNKRERLATDKPRNVVSGGPFETPSEFLRLAQDTIGERRRGRGYGSDRREGREVQVEGLCPTGGFWEGCDWVLTRPERVGGMPSLRPTKPGVFPLAHGVPDRVALLRGAGNAIVPQQAAAFIKAVIGLE